MKIIELASKANDTLDWRCEIALAEKAVANGEKIFWKFNLGLEQPFFPLEDELRFQALSLALIQFSNEVWPKFQDTSFGLCLYRGESVLPSIFSWTERQQSAYATWIMEEELPDNEHSKRLFCLEAFAVYFQMLSHRLPDEANVFLLFDFSGFSTPSSIFEALGKERFEHFTVALKGKDLPREGFYWEGESIRFLTIDSSIGVVFPANRESYADFDRYLAETNTAVKVVFESFLSEEWEGLDQLVVFSKNLTLQGNRMLKGFSATGGEVILI